MPLVGTKANAGAFGLGWSASSVEVLGGMVLITPTSIASTGTGNSSSIGANGSVTFSSCATLSLNGVFTSEYDNYMISMRWTSSGTSNADLRLRTSGTDATTNYTRQFLYVDSTTVQGGRAATDYLVRAYAYGTQRAGVSIYLFGPNLAQPTAGRTVVVDDYLSASIYEFAGTHSTASSYDGFSFIFGGPTGTGLVSVYGLGG